MLVADPLSNCPRQEKIERQEIQHQTEHTSAYTGNTDDKVFRPAENSNRDPRYEAKNRSCCKAEYQASQGGFP
ncbi:hypothetical protein AGR8A_Cc40219 [Agrobacterium fabrum str. J-07]|nr:hypothetical protein AGR8A_Cc40219 [Agrobacterium fabrum str. J-07]